MKKIQQQNSRKSGENPKRSFSRSSQSGGASSLKELTYLHAIYAESLLPFGINYPIWREGKAPAENAGVCPPVF